MTYMKRASVFTYCCHSAAETFLHLKLKSKVYSLQTHVVESFAREERDYTVRTHAHTHAHACTRTFNSIIVTQGDRGQKNAVNVILFCWLDGYPAQDLAGVYGTSATPTTNTPKLSLKES